MVQMVLGHGRACRGPTTRPMPWRSRSGRPTPSASARRGRGAVMDRAAVAPITRGELELRAGRPRGARRREAPSASARRQAHRVLGRRTAVIASVEGVGRGDRRRFAGHRGRRASATGCSRRPAILAAAAPGGRLKLHTYHLVREDQQALYGFRTAEELGLLQPAADRDRRRAEGRAGDRRQSRPTADLQLAIMTGDQAVLVSIPGIGKKLAERIIFELKEKVAAAGVAARRAVAAGAAARRGRGRRRAPGARLLAGRGARGVARRRSPTSASASTLEERVKAALRSLVRGLTRADGRRPARASAWMPRGSIEAPARAGGQLGERLLVEDLEHRVADVDHHVAQRAGRLVRARARP